MGFYQSMPGAGRQFFPRSVRAHPRRKIGWRRQRSIANYGVGKTLVFIWFLVFCIRGNALDFNQDKLLEPIFKEVEHPWVVQGLFDLPFYSFYLGAPSVHGIAYLPNFAPRLGARVLFKDVGATLTLALPIPKEERTRRGSSTQTGLLLNSYWRRSAMDLYYREFRGFYVSSPFTELSLNKPDRYPQLPDARVKTFGANFYFVANPERYSLKAAFDCSEFQTESGGSTILNPFFNHLEISIGNKFVPGIGSDALAALPNLASGRMDTMGLAFGYGYTVIRGRFFATLQGAIGPAGQYQRIQRADGNNTEVLAFAAKLNVNGSFGWNADEYVGGFKGLIDTLWAEISDTQVYSSLINAQIFFGKRF